MGNRKLVLYIASSLDGYIATNEHGLGWLESVEGEGDNGYSEFFSTIETIIMGRVTYDWVIANVKSGFPYKGYECYVFSRSSHGQNDDVVFVDSDVETFVEGLKGKEGRDIWLVGGGDLLSSFVKAKLIDEIIVTIAPVLLGGGIPLFRGNNFETKLMLKSAKTYGQFAELRYEVI